MSIYPVQLSKWFPVGDDKHEDTRFLIKITRCLACRKRCRFKAAVGHHSVPWGNGDIWCSWKCCHSGKIAKPDKRRERRYKHKLKDIKLELRESFFQLENKIIEVIKEVENEKS